MDAPPSRLSRGQGTEKSFYIFKIDLIGSTMLMAGKRKATYLRLAHTFLSTVDRITQDYGADKDQTEYAGDSVLAYFPERVDSADVIIAAFYTKRAVERIANLGGAVGDLKPRCKLVLHFAPLIVANIGPRAASVINVIGHPIHRVAKIEKEIGADVGRVTTEFYQQVAPAKKKFFSEVATEKQVHVPANNTFSLLSTAPPRTLAGLLSPNTRETLIN